MIKTKNPHKSLKHPQPEEKPESENLQKFITTSVDGCYINCWIQPKASKTKICGMYGDSLKILVAAPPIDGKANIELCKYFGKKLEVSKSSLKIHAGEKSRKKVLFCKGVSKNILLNRLFHEIEEIER